MPRFHLAYLQRDGASLDGRSGELYNGREAGIDRDAFLERCGDDRHHFRFIVSPEDGAQLQDLQAFTRDLMHQVEQDLGTRLDWVAVDHHNTGHPHSHVLVRGVDEVGKALLIARDYMAHGFRLRAAELATLELGPQTELEIQAKLLNEVGQDRLTRIDRAMLKQANGQALDLNRTDQGDRRFMRQVMVAQLKKLERMGLAVELRSGQWRLDEKLEPTLTRMGDRDDIIKTMHRALDRKAGSYRIHDGTDRHGEPVMGRLVAKGLADELGDRRYLIIDGIDGKAHYVNVGADAGTDDLRTNSIVSIRSTDHEARPADRVIFARGLLATLRDRELSHQARVLEAETGLMHHHPSNGERIEGVYRRSLQLASGRFAMIAGDRKFSLVPWRPILERSRNKQVTGIVRGDTISWQLGRKRGLGIS